MCIPEVGEKQWTERERKKREEKKKVLTMVSYACERHHGWHMQTTWTNEIKKIKSEKYLNYKLSYATRYLLFFWFMKTMKKYDVKM